MQNEVHKIPLEQLIHFKNHPFKIYSDKRLKDLAESVKGNGVLTPIIVRPTADDDKYEILSGHNRVEAAKLTDENEIPAVIREDLKGDDEKALLVVTLTNLQQRGFGELTHSERANVIKLTHDSLKNQGKRTDLIAEVDALFEGKELLSNVRKKLTPREAVAEQFGLNAGTIGLYLRLEKLTPELLDRLDDGDFELTVSEKLTYLSLEKQKIVESVSRESNIKLTIGKARSLVNASKKEPLTEETVREILEYRQVKKSKHRLTLDVLEQYFADKSPDDIDEVISKALEAYFRSNNE